MEPKVAQDMVNYRAATGPESCGTCANFQADATCSVVMGPISVQNISDLYQPSEQDLNPDPGPDLSAGPVGMPGADVANQLFGGM